MLYLRTFKLHAFKTMMHVECVHFIQEKHFSGNCCHVLIYVKLEYIARLFDKEKITRSCSHKEANYCRTTHLNLNKLIQ